MVGFFIYIILVIVIIKVMKKTNVSLKRHILKTVTWRVVGTIDTMLLGWLVSGDPMVGITIGSFEVVTKMILYFLHERAWYKIDFGVDRDENVNN
jgi:uncharacterized membrane protein